MSNYEQLLQKIVSQNDQVKTDGLRKLVYLAVNDQANFRRYAQRIVETVNTAMDDMFEDETKLLSLQLLSELISNYKATVPKSVFELGNVVVCLSDQKVFDLVMQQLEIRKASHYLILTFVKKYEKVDEILNTYRQVGEVDNISWKVIQKIIHSFESLIIFEPKCVTYAQDFSSMDGFLTFVMKRGEEDNSLLKKASEQALTSFVKNEYAPQILPKLNNYVSEQLRSHSKTVNVKLPEPQDILQEVVIEQQPKNRLARVSLNRTQSHSPKPTPILPVQRKPSQLRLTIPDPPPTTKPQYQSRLSQLLQKIQMQNIWSVKCQAIDQLNRLLTRQSIHQIPELLVQRVLDLTSDLNFKTCVTSMNTIYYLVTECYESIRPHMKQIEEVLVEKMCDMKLAIRQLAGKIIKEVVGGGKEAEMEREREKTNNIMRLLMHKLQTCSLLGKEEIIGLVMEIYAREGCWEEGRREEVVGVVGELAMLLYNQNTKIKMKTVEALVKISLNTDLEECKRVLVKRLNKVYYDMFLNQLKERANERWQDNKNKGLSFQIERPAFAYDKPFSTKKEVPNSDKQLYFRRHEDNLSVNEKPQNETFFSQAKGKNNAMNTTTNTEVISTVASHTRQYKQGKATASTNFGEFTTTLLGPKTPQERFNLVVKNKYNGVGGFYDEDELKIINTSNPQQKDESKPSIYQYKPTLKKPIHEQKKAEEMSNNSNTEKPKEDDLIIESRQYRFKRPVEEEKPNKEQRKSNIKLTKPFSRKKPWERVQEETEQQQKREVVTKPFNKKSSKNQPRVIDYKATQYTAKQELEPFDNVDYALKKIEKDIKKQDDWSVQFQTLNSIRRVIKHHSQSMNGLAASLSTTMPQVLKLVESLRSSLAKNAMITLAEMCESLKRNMDPFLDQIFPRLFRKSLDTNTFINEQVKKCLGSLCTYCTPQKVIPIILNNSQSKQTQVKLYILLCIQKLAQRTPNNKLQIIRQSNRLATIIGSYIVDSSAEVRTGCKHLFCNIVRESPKPEVEGIFRRSTNQESYNKLKNILDKEVLAADIVVKSSSKKRIDFD